MSQNNSPAKLTRRSFLRIAAGAAVTGVVGGMASPVLACQGSALEDRINAYIKELRRIGRIPPDERTAWLVYDFTIGRELVAINGNEPMQAASMIKPFLAQAFFFRHRADRERFPYDGRVRWEMARMIQNSNNIAADFFINVVGAGHPAYLRPRVVERVLKRHAGDIFQQTSIVQYIPEDGRAYLNKASARDYGRFLYAMHKDLLPYAKQIQYYMGLPKPNRIVDGAVAVPRCAKLYDKTGTTAEVCGDMGILVTRSQTGRPYPYIFVGIIQKDRRARDYGWWMRDRGNIIRHVSDLVYRFMYRRYHVVL